MPRFNIYSLKIQLALAAAVLAALSGGILLWQMTHPKLQWGAYVGEVNTSLPAFETLVGKKPDIVAVFIGWDTPFPTSTAQLLGAQNKTLLIFWEPSFGYDQIIDGSNDAYISQFAADAKANKYPIILAPFDEMNLGESAWGYGQNGNTAAKFTHAWQHVHDLFGTSTTNVKFGLAYNNESIPNTPDNSIDSYYPGNGYVDYIGVDGFNFNDPYKDPSVLFDRAMQTLELYHKPIYIFSTGAVAGDNKAAWITKFGEHIKTYPNLRGWVWFNQDGQDGNWVVDSSPGSLEAFKTLLP